METKIMTETELKEEKISVNTLVRCKEKMMLSGGIVIYPEAVGTIIEINPIMDVRGIFKTRSVQIGNLFVIGYKLNPGIIYNFYCENLANFEILDKKL